MPRAASVIAADMPGFGYSDQPAIDKFEYTFAHLADVMDDFLKAIDVQKYSIYVMDYGSPVGFRLFVKHPERIRRTLQGTELDGWKYRHPLVEREGPVVMGAHATADAGTGLVHTAPGHGEDDFNMGVQYGLPIWAPVDGHGRFTADVAIAGLDPIGIDTESAIDATRDGKRASVLNQKHSGGHVAKRDALAGRDRLDDVEIAAGERVPSGCDDRRSHEARPSRGRGAPREDP